MDAISRELGHGNGQCSFGKHQEGAPRKNFSDELRISFDGAEVANRDVQVDEFVFRPRVTFMSSLY